MWAGVFEIIIVPEERVAFEAAWEEFAALRERQPGFRGTIEIAADERRMLGLVLWDSREAHDVANFAPHNAPLAPALNRVRALLTIPPKGLASGGVTGDSLTTAEPFDIRSALALVNEAVITPEHRAGYDAENRELWALRALQPGFHGSIEFDAGEGRVVWLAVWANREAIQVARDALLPTIDRVHRHIPAGSRGPLGAGAMVRNTIARGTALESS